MELEQLLTKDADNYRFHGPRGWLSTLIEQSANGEITLWGRTHDDAVDDEDEAEWVQGEGYLYVADIRDYDICYKEFMEDGEVVLVLEKQVDEPQEWYPRTGERERLIRVEEWKVIGGIHPLSFDEDGDVLEEEAIALDDLLSENF